MDDNPYALFGNEGARAAFDFDPQATTLRATFTLDRATLHRALRLYFARNRRLRWFINLALLALAPLLFLVKPGEPIGPAATFLVLALVALNSPPFFYLASGLALLIMRVRAAPSIFRPHVVEVKDGELVESTEINRSAFKLKAIVDVYQNAGVVIIVLPGGLIEPIPESADFGADSFDTFCLKLSRAVDAAKAADKAGTFPG
ncbi:MAG TPA: hypothetical protein VG125_14375 [Pirellulales bacterium]|jgi:hypothetical protein|nr:hypothetical protein [Pirellulales bacterium]